jgi:chromosome segregation ATPase
MKAVLAIAVSTLLTAAAHAQTERTGNADARVMQQVQQLTSERMQLKSENDRIKKELDEAKQQLTKLQAEQSGLKQKADAATAGLQRTSTSNQDAASQLETTRAQLQELIAKFRETGQSLREVETDRSQVRGELAAKQRELNVCIDRNAEMYSITGETLDRLSKRGNFSAFADHEPFTQLSRTRLDNLIEDYRYRVDELRIEKSTEQRAK